MEANYFLHCCPKCNKAFALKYFSSGMVNCPFCQQALQSRSFGSMSEKAALVLSLTTGVKDKIAFKVSLEEYGERLRQLIMETPLGEEKESLYYSLGYCNKCGRAVIEKYCHHCEWSMREEIKGALISAKAAISLGLIPEPEIGAKRIASIFHSS